MNLSLLLLYRSIVFVSDLFRFCVWALNVTGFIVPLSSGLADVADVQVLCHQILAKLCVNPRTRPPLLDAFDTPSRSTVHTRHHFDVPDH